VSIAVNVMPFVVSQSRYWRLSAIRPSEVPHAIHSSRRFLALRALSDGNVRSKMSGGSTLVVGEVTPGVVVPSGHIAKAPLNDPIHSKRSGGFSPTYVAAAPP